MSSALGELELLVKEQRGEIAGEVERQTVILKQNSNSLIASIEKISKKSLTDLEQSAAKYAKLQDFVAALYCYIERLRTAELNVIDLLCSLCESKFIQFQPIGDHLPEFHYLSSQLRIPTFYSIKSDFEHSDSLTSSSSVDAIGLSAVFKIRLNNRHNAVQFDSARGMGDTLEDPSSKLIFTVLSLENLQRVISRGWKAISEESIVFSSDAWASAALHASQVGSDYYSRTY